MANNTSPHILNTSATLLGFCLFVITSLQISNYTEHHIIDELTSGIAVLLTNSCIFSFISMRTDDVGKVKRFESIADYLFVASLVGILVIILLITLEVVK